MTYFICNYFAKSLYDALVLLKDNDVIMKLCNAITQEETSADPGPLLSMTSYKADYIHTCPVRST